MATILSTTTTASRLHVFSYAIQSLLAQSVKPDRFLVNIDRTAFTPEGPTPVPDWLRRDDVIVNLVTDVRSYTKLLPAISESSDDDVIVTADDDIIYKPTWLEELLDRSETNSRAIVCGRARYMPRNAFGNWKNYALWDNVDEVAYGLDLLPLGVGGVVYRHALVDLDFLTDSQSLTIAPTADDLWFREASLRRGTPVYVDPSIETGNMEINHGSGLLKTNARKLFRAPFFKRRVERTIDYLGINRTAYDHAWDAIRRYSEAHQ